MMPSSTSAWAHRSATPLPCRLSLSACHEWGLVWARRSNRVLRVQAVEGRRRVTDAVERYLGSDPGGERFRSGLNAVVAWLAAVGVVAFLESLTHAFEVSSSTPGAGAINHSARL